MAWETIDVVKPKAASATACPEAGVKVMARKFKSRSGGDIRYLRVAIGPKLAKGISLVAPEHRLRVMFGTGEDAGKIAVAVDHELGKFLAKRSKIGGYSFAINAATCEGLFATEFPTFTVANCEALRPVNGQPPKFIFKASADMLKVED